MPFIVLSLIPFVNLAVAVASPLLSAGFAAMAHAGYRGERARLGHLLGGFRRQTSDPASMHREHDEASPASLKQVAR